jgi:hypothetical protein
MGLTAIDRMYPKVNAIIVRALMYDNLAQAVKEAVALAMTDAFKRCVEENGAAYSDKWTNDYITQRHKFEEVCEYSFEYIMDAVGSGLLKKGITGMIIDANHAGWEMAREMFEKDTKR